MKYKRKSNIITVSDEELRAIRSIRKGNDYVQEWGVYEARNIFCTDNYKRFADIKTWVGLNKKSLLSQYHRHFKQSLRVMGGYGRWYKKIFMDIQDENK